MENAYVIEPGCHYHTVGADPEHMLSPDIDAEGNSYVEILCPGDAAKLLVSTPPPPEQCARLRVYLGGVKKAVIDRDTDLLTNDEYRANAELVKR